MTTALAIVERSYRGTLEQQYAHVLWLVRSLHRQAPVTLLLRGAAAIYATTGPVPTPLWLGGEPCGAAPDFGDAIARLRADDGTVLVCAASLSRLRIGERALIAGVRPVTDSEIARVATACDAIWYL